MKSKLEESLFNLHMVGLLLSRKYSDYKQINGYSEFLRTRSRFLNSLLIRPEIETT